MDESVSTVSFLTKLRICWIASLSHRLSRSAVHDTEAIARFLFASKEFKLDRHEVRPVAFIVKNEHTEHSVYRIDGLSHDLVCALGDWRVVPTRRKNHYGYARLNVGEARANGVGVYAKERPKRHAYIADWPLTKPERLAVAQSLAAASSFCPAAKESASPVPRA
jgi:hypothetical protein